MCSCIEHFCKEDSFFLETGQKSLALLAIPTRDLPKKSHDDKPKIERRELIRHSNFTKEKTTASYSSLSELSKRSGKLKLNGWSIDDSQLTSNQLKFKKLDADYQTPFIEITVDESLEFFCHIFG